MPDGLLPADHQRWCGDHHLRLLQAEEAPRRGVEGEREDPAESRTRLVLPLYRALGSEWK
jgi:hypothetical protein